MRTGTKTSGVILWLAADEGNSMYVWSWRDRANISGSSSFLIKWANGQSTKEVIKATGDTREQMKRLWWRKTITWSCVKGRR